MSGPVFVVGVNGSGTTMLSDALGRHPGLYMLPDESRVLPYFAQRYPDSSLQAPAGRRALADTLGASRAYRRANGKKPVVVEGVDSLEPRFEAVVGAVYLTLAGAEGKTRWGDKSPMYLQHIELLATHFPDAKFVHIYRDARDSAQSFHRRWKQEPRRTVYRWKHAIRAGRAQGQQLGSGRYLEVAYESLTEKPEECMRRVCEFLELRYDPVVLVSSMRWMDETARQASQGRIVRNSGRWKSYFSEGEVRELERIAGRMLDELGYEVTERGDEDPDVFRLWLWKWLDRLRFTMDHFKSYGVSSLPGYLRRVRDALRQATMNRF